MASGIIYVLREIRFNSVTMMISSFIVTCLFVAGTHSSRKFPVGFKFGSATSAHQIEGAWNVSDKTPSMWDVFVHESHNINGTGDIACDSYHQWKQDVEAAIDLGLDFYRFSISWTRILPSGLPGPISKDGARYYNNLIDALLENNIEPVVTLYHWDLPKNLQDFGGWTNPLISDWFSNYARIVYSLFADRVKTWVTINEPLSFCEIVYSMGIHAPGVHSPGIGDYLCAKHAMIAHAKAWRIYDEEFRPKYHGRVSMTNQILWFQSKNPEDEELAELARQFGAGIYSHPIYSKTGGWPPSLEKFLANTSDTKGYPASILPKFTKEEIKLIRGTYDFYGLNYYTTRNVQKAKEGQNIASRPIFGIPELRALLLTQPEWFANHPWFYIYPPGLRKLLNWIKREYGDVEILILENGLVQADTNLNDPKRIKFYKEHLEQVLLAIYEDGVNVTAYTAWTMLDNFEWTDGYDFGLYAVDFADPLRKRTPRDSAYYYANVIKHRSLDVPEVSRIYRTNNGAEMKINYLNLFYTIPYIIILLLVNA